MSKLFCARLCIMPDTNIENTAQNLKLNEIKIYIFVFIYK